MVTSTANPDIFRSLVGIKFQLYNSLFTALPFHKIEKTGILLSLFLTHCEEQYKQGKSPAQVIQSFFDHYAQEYSAEQKTALLFRFIQYTERQVVLFDALEDASFTTVNDVKGAGTLTQLYNQVLQQNLQQQFAERVEDFAVRIVLTAHPTQFYPGEVLGIINDLSDALAKEDTLAVNLYLQQLGKTPFFKKTKPTPFDEAMSLIWYMQHVFYKAAGNIIYTLKQQLPGLDHIPFEMGFWPGGDRDGNPFVTADITRQVAAELHNRIIKCYYKDVKELRRRLTFKGVDDKVQQLEKSIYNYLFDREKNSLSVSYLQETLQSIREVITEHHNGLFVNLIDELSGKISTFGFHFATLDIRQSSDVHTEVIEQIAATTDLLPGYKELSQDEKIRQLLSLEAKLDPEQLTEALHQDTLRSMQAIRDIQQQNGEKGCNRYIISQCNTALNLIEVYALLHLSGFNQGKLPVDIVPLFETIGDLEHAAGIMEQLYALPAYREHLQRRNNTQPIMLGFSDGTKDGGYLMANYSIYKAKDELTAISRKYEVEVVFFDGRGGPPSRGGGKTHRFYASMGKNIANKEIEITVQGQTVSSNFGTVPAAQYNIEQLLHAGLSSAIFTQKERTLTPQQEACLKRLSVVGFEAYKALKADAQFMDYLSAVSPLRFYADTNIASRPTKRNAGKKLELKDLRAIPYVGAFSQIKQNVTGYYGVGSALKNAEEQGYWEEVKDLYNHSLFFRTMIDNCEMVMRKSFFPLTAYLSDDPEFGGLWNRIYSEYQLTDTYLRKLSGKDKLMDGYATEELSISMRERIVLPLITIQQYALNSLRHGEGDTETLEKLVIRCSFGIINAGRNAV
jgi:phosphoenolpyruvate carboxylase